MTFECTVDVILRRANIKASYLKERPSSIISLKVLQSGHFIETKFCYILFEQICTKRLVALSLQKSHLKLILRIICPNLALFYPQPLIIIRGKVSGSRADIKDQNAWSLNCDSLISPVVKSLYVVNSPIPKHLDPKLWLTNISCRQKLVRCELTNIKTFTPPIKLVTHQYLLSSNWITDTTWT